MSSVGGLLGRAFSPQRPGGVSRLAALGFFILSLAGAGVSLTQPQIAPWAGAALLAAIGVAGFLLLIAAWPSRGARADEARRAAAATAVSNVAWAVTSRDGSMLDCNVAYRF